MKKITDFMTTTTKAKGSKAGKEKPEEDEDTKVAKQLDPIT